MTLTKEFNQNVREYNALLEVLKQEIKFDDLPKQEQQKVWDEIAKHNPADDVTIDGLREYIKERFSEEKLKEIEKKAKKTPKGKSKASELTPKIYTLLLQKKKGQATELIVNYILTNEKIYTTRCDENSEMWIYKEGIYLPQARTYIQETCREILDDIYTTNLYNQVVSKIEADTYINQDDFFKEEDVNLIAVENGILNLKTKELMPFDSKYRFFAKLPVEYDKNKDCKKIKAFFESLFKDKNEIEVVQEIFGYLLHKDYFLEKAFMFLGTGRNGKGKTISLMKEFIGIDNCSEVPLDDLERDIFALGELFKKQANLCGDLSKTALKNTGNFKKLTGRDLISANRKFLSRVKFVNYSKMIFSCNELPVTYDLTTAFFNRWIILDFPYTFLPQNEINNLPKKERKDVKLCDPSIIEKISTPEEMSGLLNWALVGLERIIKNKSFSYSPSTEETKTKWLRKSDSCTAFLMDCVEVDYKSYISKKEFRKEYYL